MVPASDHPASGAGQVVYTMDESRSTRAAAIEMAPNKFEVTCLWLIAFTSTLDVIALAFVGNSPILFSPLIAAVYLGYEFLKGRGKIYRIRSNSGAILLIFIAYVILSSFFPFFYGLGSKVDISYKGLAVLTSMLLIYTSITANPSYARFQAVLSGLLAAIITNAIYAIYQYVGSFLNLPLINIGWRIPQTELLALRRATGFFREPSYLAALLIPGLILAICFLKHFRYLAIFVISTALLLSFSSGLLLAGVGLAVLLLILVYSLMFPRNAPNIFERKKILASVLLIIMILVVSLVMIYRVPAKLTRLNNLVENAMPYSQKNIERRETVAFSFSLAIDNPIGYGYNMGPTVMENQFNISKIHSLLTALMLEIGIPGLLLFLLFIFSLAIPLLRRGSGYESMGLGLVVLLTVAFSFLTTNSMFYFQWVILGLGFLYSKRESYQTEAAISGESTDENIAV
jgi:O-antigen ligase